MKFNISIDDISPHPRSSIEVLNQCYTMLDRFPDLKFSLFIPLAYWRVSRPGTVTKKPLFVSEFSGFCEVLRNLPKENFEIGYHGFFHGRPHEGSDNNEFDGVSYEFATVIIKKMMEEAEKAGLKDVFKPMIRPPNWKMSGPAFDAASDLGIKLFALTDVQNRLDTHQGRDKQYNSVYSNCAPPNREVYVSEKCGVVYHACEWLANYLDENQAEKLMQFISENEENIEFCFLDEFGGYSGTK